MRDAQYNIQNIVFPTESKHLSCKELFYRGGGCERADEDGIFMRDGETCDLVTYFNACSWAKWKKYTTASDLTLCVEIEGRCDIRYVGYKLERNEPVRIELGNNVKTEDNAEILTFNYPDNDSVLVGAEVTAHGDCHIKSGYYQVTCNEETMQPVLLSIVTTTYRKEEFVTKNTDLLKREILCGEDELKECLDIHVVDNGRTLDESKITDDHIRLHYNRNTGGSGGFARGMMESLRKDPSATHVLLMDDDVLVMSDSIKRMFYLLKMLRPEFRECFISGAMLRYEKPYLQHEDIGTIQPEGIYKSLKPAADMRDIESIVTNEGIPYSSSRQYAGWWYCCIPAEIIRKNGLPLPLFVRGDDSEYSLRCGSKVLSMNGICIWHLGFNVKYSPALDLYQMCRNLLIVRACSDNMEDVDFYGHYSFQFALAARKFEYNAMELIILAIEDYLKGPEYIEKCDGEEILARNALLREKMRKLSEHPEVVYQGEDALHKDDKRRLFDKLYFNITDNGNRCAPGFFIKHPDRMPVTIFGLDIMPQKISRVEEYAAVNPYDGTVVIRKIDRSKYRELMSRMKALRREYEDRHLEVEEAYRRAKATLVSEEFWREYLQLKY